MEKLGASGFPTLVAFDATGKEIDRKVGFGGGPSMVGWFLELPDRQIPLDEYLKRADRELDKGRVQLVAAKRLVAADRAAEAKKYFARAERSPDKLVAVAATWALGRMELERGQEAARRKLAERICARYPTSVEASMALQYLVTLDKPPLGLVEKTVRARLANDWDSAPALNHLAYQALRAKAYKPALEVAARLEALSAKDPGQLDTVAEVHHMNGDTARAVAISERAVAMASGALAEGLRQNLERFRRGRREEGQDIKDVQPPSFAMDRPQVSPAPPRVSPARKLERELSGRLPDECAGAAAGAERLRVYVVAEEKEKARPKLSFAPGTPKGLASCATRLLEGAGIPAGTSLLLDVSMAPRPFREAVDAAVKDVEARCAKEATPGQSVDGVLSGAAGARPEVVLASGSAALRGCVQKTFSALKLPATTFRPVRFRFK